MRLRVLFFLVLGFLLSSVAAPPSFARVEITLDAATLNDFLTAVTPPTVLVSLPSGRDIALELRSVRVVGFDPAAGAGGRGHVLTTLRIGIPALGLEFPLEPRLSLDIVEEKGEKIAVLRFEKVDVPLPVTGTLDVSSLLPVYRVPAEASWSVAMAQGNVRVKSRLVDTRMGAEALRLGFDVEMASGK